MAQTKATKKFEKNRLKETLERRNNLKKTKQKQQLKAKKKARRAEDNAISEADEAAKQQNGDAAAKAKVAFQDMSVDDFFQGGFDIPELPKSKGIKRRRAVEQQEDESDEEESDLGPAGDNKVGDAASEDESDEDLEDHQQQLDALAENDPEFHKYLQENEPELLGGALAEAQAADDAEHDGEPKRKKQKKDPDDSDDETFGLDSGSNELTKAALLKWRNALTEQHSLRATREVAIAFRSASHASEEDDKDYKYSISDPEVYHQLLTLALKHVPGVFAHHLPIQENKSGKLHVSTESKKFKTMGPILKAYMASILHLLDHLSDPSTLRITLSAVLPMVPYLLSFKKIIRDLGRAVTNVWASTAQTEASRVAAFLVLRRLVVTGDPGIRESILKATYQGLIKGSRQTTVHTIAGVNLMKNSAAELWGLDSGVGYTTAFTYIRQLAIHLRSSIQAPGKESHKQVYNWQYVHSLDFWSRVLSAHCTEANSLLRPLIYPLVQVTQGVLRLIPTATYFPLRFQLVRALLRLSRATNTYIPLAPALYEVLSSAEMRKPPKPSTLKPLDFATSIRAPKSYLRTRIYQDSVGEQVQELLGEFFVLWCKNIAFPELALPVVVILKRWMKDVNNRVLGKGNKNQKVNNAIALLVQKVEANSRFVTEKRSKVEFAPSDRKGVEAFLKDLEWEKTPLGAFIVGQRKGREERAKVLEEARKDDQRREKQSRKDKRSAMDIDDEEDEEDEDDDEEDPEADDDEFDDED